MQTDHHAITLSQDGDAHSRGGAGGHSAQLLPGLLWPRVRATGAGPGGHSTRPRGRISGWHSRTRGSQWWEEGGVPGLMKFHATGH